MRPNKPEGWLTERLQIEIPEIGVLRDERPIQSCRVGD